MSDKSAIEWTDATWNPVTGCSKVSPGCANCYAESYTERMAGRPGWVPEFRPWTPANAAYNVRLHPERLNVPLGWREPRMVFVNSMSDLFHELVPFEFIVQVFDVMRRTPRHTYQVLTKRPERLATLMGSLAAAAGPWIEWPLPNVWIGTSIENDRWTVRADHLRAMPGDWTRFLSCEPLLGPLPSLDLTDLDWVIVGGESGIGHRPIDPAWVRDIRDRCVEAGVAFFFKQWGGRTPKSGGRLLDGRTWDEMPRTLAAA